MFRTYVDVVHVHRDESRRLFSAAGGAADAAAAEAEPTVLSCPNTPADSQSGEPPVTETQADPAAASDEQFVAIENITAEELREVEGQIKVGRGLRAGRRSLLARQIRVLLVLWTLLYLPDSMRTALFSQPGAGPRFHLYVAAHHRAPPL